MKHVKEFHLAFGCPTPSVPSVPPDDRLKLRLKLIAEEFVELLEACGCQHLEQLELVLAHVVHTASSERTYIVEAIDALGDLDYVNEGMRLEFGTDGEPVATEIHRSNMAKVGSAKREDGKIMKPPGWTPPDIAGELRKQGWKG